MKADRNRFLMICLTGVAILSGGCGPTAKKARREAATAQAKLFLECIKNRDGKSAYGLLSDGYIARLSEEESKTKKLNINDIIGDANIRAVNLEPADRKNGDDAKVVLKGKLERYTLVITLGERTHTWTSYDFRLVMVRDAKQKEWRVELFTTRAVKKQYGSMTKPVKTKTKTKKKAEKRKTAGVQPSIDPGLTNSETQEV